MLLPPASEPGSFPVVDFDNWRAGGIVIARAQGIHEPTLPGELFIALVEQDTSNWSFPDDREPTALDLNALAIPKGHIEVGDSSYSQAATFLRAATREVVEETGIPESKLFGVPNIGPVRFTRESRDGTLKRIHYEHFVVAAAMDLNPPKFDTAGSPNNIVRASWFNLLDAARELPNPKDREIIIRLHKTYLMNALKRAFKEADAVS